MKKIITIALLTATGSGAALAQGAPASFVPWQSGWRGTAAAPQAQGLGMFMARLDGHTVLAKNGGSVPITGNSQGRSRGG